MVIFRDAMVDLGPRFTSTARGRIAAVMNYVGLGGACICFRPPLSAVRLIVTDRRGLGQLLDQTRLRRQRICRAN